MTFIENRERLLPDETERLEVGEVRVVSEERVIDQFGHAFHRRRVEVGDQSDRDPQLRTWYHERTNQFEQMLRLHGDDEWKKTKRNDDGTLFVDPNNKPAMDLYYDESYQPTQMSEWGTQMKEAIALEGLQNLEKGGRFLPGGQLDERTLELFTHMTDGIGLRSRQHIYRELLIERASRTANDTLKIASLGSGAAVPNIEATIAVESKGKQIEWLLFDLDPRALGYAEIMIADSEIKRSTFDLGPMADGSSPTKYEGRSYLDIRHSVEDDSLDAVDALGLWEYLTETQAATFLRVNYKKLKPGAPMIVSNMLKTRPHAEYNKSAVGWPDLYMRDEEDMLNIVRMAGIPVERVRFTYPSDGVYVVMEIYK